MVKGLRSPGGRPLSELGPAPDRRSASPPQVGALFASARVALPALAVVVFLFTAWWYRNFTLDDPFISFRYARNLLRGLGPVYNPGQPIEGVSNPLWVALAALWMALFGTDAETTILVAKIVGGLFGLLALLGAWRLAALIQRTPSGLAGGAAVLSLALTLYFPAWSIGGLETPLFAAAIVWLAVFLTEETMLGGLRWRSALLGACCATIRPEGLLLAGVAGAAGLFDIARRRDRRAGALALAALPFAAVALLLLGRRLYYGDWLPNTYYAKSGQGRAVSLDEGVLYVQTWLFGPGALLAATAALGLGIIRWRRRSLVAGGITLALTALLLLVTAWEGGDWMPGYRFLVPIMPLLAACAGAGVARAVAWSHPARFVVIVAACALLVLTPRLAYQDMQRRVSWAGTAESRPLIPEGYLAFGQWARAHIPAESVIAIGEAGIIPYVSEHTYIDIFGLNDRTIARMPGRWQDKAPTRYILGRDPDYIVLVGDLGGPPADQFAYTYANALFTDGEFRAKYREVHLQTGIAVFCRVAAEGCRKPLIAGAAHSVKR